MLFTYFLEAFLIGMAGAAIFGPISMLFVQKTLKLGIKGAFAVGLGAVSADLIDSVIACAGLSAVAHFLMGKIIIIEILGGSFLLYLAGKELLIHKQGNISVARIATGKNMCKLSLQTFLLAITGPLNILFFMSVFANIGGKEISVLGSLLMVLGIFLGSVVWLTFLGSIVMALRTHLSTLWLNRTRSVSAIVLGCFGLWALYSAMTHQNLPS